MDENRKQVIAAAILLLSKDQFTQTGLPDVSELNAALPKGTAPVSANGRTEVWEAMLAEQQAAAEQAAAEALALDNDTKNPAPPDQETAYGTPEEGPTFCKIRIIKANGNPFDLRVNGKVVARLVTGQVYENFPDEFLPALNDTDTKYEEVR